MLSYGIPPQRLPQDVVENEINYIRELGVEFKTNTRIGDQITLDDLRAEGYKAFLVACGMQRSKSIEINDLDL